MSAIDDCPTCSRDLWHVGHVCPPASDDLANVGWCTACGSVEVTLNRVTGTRDLSHIGESDRYPTGYGCEMCA